VTTLAVSAALQEIPFDTGRLFDGDPLYELWLAEVLVQVMDIREAEYRRMGGSR
jgi:hypothetical protein